MQVAHGLRTGDLWSIVGLPLVIAVMVVYFATQSEFFLTSSNFENIGRNIMAIAILAAGQAFVIVLAEVDISVGAVVGLTTVTTALLVEQIGTLGAVAAPLTGLAIGLLNGVVVARFGVHSVIVTIGTLTLCRGLAFEITNGTPVVVDFPSALTWLGEGKVGPFPAPFVITVIVFVLTALTFRLTSFGPRLYATGGNEEAALLAGINTQRVKIAAFCVSGLLAGVVGLILAGRISSGQPTIGAGLELQSIAAAVVGGMALTGGRGTVGGVALGVVLLTVLQNGLDISDVSSYLQQVVSGVVILLAVIIDSIRTRGRRRSGGVRRHDRPASSDGDNAEPGSGARPTLESSR